MARLAIELNDPALAIAGADGVAAFEPGCAFVSEEGLAFGRDALALSRLKPRQVLDRYWAELGLDPLPRPLPGVKSPADVAHAQLQQLWKRFGSGVEEVVFVVPGSFDRAQLALLLGIAEACGIPVRGLVDGAVAASEVAYPGWDVLHLEAQLHGIGLTRLTAGPEAFVESFQPLTDFGLAKLTETWARRIGSAFVAQTRFDPFSSGSTEQVFFDALPGWLAALAGSPVAELTLEVAGVTRSVSVARDPRGSDGRSPYDALVEALRAELRPGSGTALLLGAELGGVPGVAEALARLPGLRVVPLHRGAGALGALARLDEIRAEPKAIRLVTRLARHRSAELPPLEPERESGATHALVAGYAHPVGGDGLLLRPDGAGGVAIAAAGEGDPGEPGPGEPVAQGVRLVRCDGELRLEGASDGVLVNGRPADGAALEPGDRVRVPAGDGDGDGDVEVEVIALVGSP